jgi:hypothetical protein
VVSEKAGQLQGTTVYTRPKPMAQCTRCGKAYPYVQAADVRCIAGRNLHKCRGLVRAMFAENDWRSCANCRATGSTDEGGACSYCEGIGWIANRT